MLIVASSCGLMLDVAWALFELRLLRDPSLDPNRLWSDITHHYLHIVPHPEYSWWAVRIQLVRVPGHMVNYGLGEARATRDILTTFLGRPVSPQALIDEMRRPTE